MSSSFNRIKKNMIEAMQSANNQGTSAYDSVAEVRRVEGDTAWVHIAGGVDETPVKLTIAAKAGDVVQVRVGGGRAWITGNASAPPTDDKTAIAAKGLANIAGNRAKTAQKTAAAAGVAADVAKEHATVAQSTADAAKAAAKATAAHFWSDSEGAHVTHTEEGETISGGNTLITEDGMEVRDGNTTLARFSGDGAQIGQEGKRHSVVDTDGFHVSDGYETYFHAGYSSDAVTSSGEKTYSPFFTFGRRQDGSAIGVYSVAEGDSIASGAFSHSEGSGSATGNNAHAEGAATVASNNSSHAEGESTQATGPYSHAEGNGSAASGSYSHAEGNDTTASGAFSHAEGNSTTASGRYSHAEGSFTTASGEFSHAQNDSTIAAYEAQTVIGKYNSNVKSNAFEIGNGTGYRERSNAFTVDWSGNVTASGTISDSTGNLRSAIDGKANTNHTHSISDITDLAKRFQAGNVLMTPGAETVTYNGIKYYKAIATITFRTEFDEAPEVVIAPTTAVPHRMFVAPADVTATGFTINFFRDSKTATGIHWIAMGGTQ